MARVCTYLNFDRETEEAFLFYQSVFGGEFSGGGVARLRHIPPSDDAPVIAESDLDLIMHIELPILAGHVLMGTDAPESMGMKVITGNNVHIHLEPDTREETTRLFNALSEGGSVSQPLHEVFWGAYFGSCTDKFGVQWMFNCVNRATN